MLSLQETFLVTVYLSQKQTAFLTYIKNAKFDQENKEKWSFLNISLKYIYPIVCRFTCGM